MEEGYKELFIVISQTGSFISRLLKFITGAEFNHVSLCLKSDLKLMYSFGRKKPYFPFPGGFVLESPDFGTFKFFSNTNILVLGLKIDSKKYHLIEEHINNMLLQQKKYKYNYIGVVLAGFKICYKSPNKYYCSEFVRDILYIHNVKGTEKICGIVEPMDFINLPDITHIYSGKLKNYCVNEG